jgi:hypothetical protein
MWKLTEVSILGESSPLIGSIGTAFAMTFQSYIGQIGGAVGPQLFRTMESV